MNSKLKNTVLETIKRAKVKAQTLANKDVAAYEAHVSGGMLRISRQTKHDGVIYTLSMHEVMILPPVKVPAPNRTYPNYDTTDIVDIWNAMGDKYKQQELDAKQPMDLSHEYVYDVLNKFCREHDRARTAKAQAATKTKGIAR